VPSAELTVARPSAGILVYRRRGGGLEVLLVHPGGPFWARKDAGAWTIPKGEHDAGEDALAAARRELREETGLDVEGPFEPLPPARQRGGKLVSAWAVEGDFDVSALASNTFEMEWPPRSGRRRRFPEVDRAEWFPLHVAETKINDGQRPLLQALRRLHDPPGERDLED
jgi:predicted NUDIX family NTP pyrophosphohydrolase